MGSSASSRRSPGQRRRSVRLGSEVPRIWTKPLRPLTARTSLGFSVIEFATDVLGIELLPWQRWLLIHMLELLPDNTMRFRTVVVLVARQNGKSTLSQVIALWFMYHYGAALVIGTAQDLDVAEEIWQGAVELAEENEDLSPLIEAVVKVNGKKALQLTGGERYKVKAANRRAGRGLSGDVILLDELREHQTWDAWGAITKTTMARAQALILALSNAGDASSVVLRYLRQMCLQQLVDDGEEELRAELDEILDQAVTAYAAEGIDEAEAYANEEDEEPVDELDFDDDSVAIFEWSAPPGIDRRDRDGWAQANPSLGYTITERTIASACKTDPEWIFRTEVLCQWSNATLDGPFPAGAWEAAADPESRRAEGAEVALCVDVAWDRSRTHIALASWREDGDVHGEVIASRAGTDWPIAWLTDPARSEAVRGAPVAVQAKGAPASSLIQALREAGVNVVEWGGTDLGIGCGQMYDRVAGVRASVDEDGARHPAVPPSFHHTGKQPLLTAAASSAATKRSGDAWFWDRIKSPLDASPLVAQTGAVWCLSRPKPKPKPAPRVRMIGGRAG